MVRAGELTYARIYINGLNSTGPNQCFMVVNLLTGEIPSRMTGDNFSDAVFSVEPHANGWWLCTVSVVSDDADSVVARIYSLSNVAGTGGIGDGVSGILFAYADLKIGSKSSYIPTEGSQVTRAADSFILPVGDWYRQDEGTLVVDCVPLPFGNSYAAMLYGDATRRIGAYNIWSRGVFSGLAVMQNGGEPKSSPDPRFGGGLGVRSVGAVRWQEGRFSTSADGIISDDAVQPDGAPLASDLRLGKTSTGGATGAQMLIRNVRYYDRRLTDEQLIELTRLPE